MIEPVSHLRGSSSGASGASRAHRDLASALLETDDSTGWDTLRECTLAAELCDFAPNVAERLAPRLIEIALRFRDSNDARDRPVVFSAIRTGGSMLRPNEAHRLRPLLDHGHRIETCLVAVKMIGRIFEAQPPGGVDQHPDLADALGWIARSLLNPYVIAGSQSAALAQLTVHALAAMASRDVLHVVELVRGAAPDWFRRQTGRELERLHESWVADDTQGRTAPCELVAQAARLLLHG